VATCGGVVPDPALNMGSHYDVEGGGVYVPFKEQLFGAAGVATHPVAARVRGNKSVSGDVVSNQTLIIAVVCLCVM
jgi:hypothetical protein